MSALIPMWCKKIALLGLVTAMLPLTGCYPALSATSDLTPSTEREYATPSFTHRVIDAQTKVPLKGVVVWGYFALRVGSTSPGGGTKGTDYIRTFEVITDANGEYTIPAWKSGPIKAKGEPDEHAFPVIAMYKPSYRTVVYGEGSMYAISPNRREEMQGYGGGKATDKGAPAIDLRDDPTGLIPTKTLRERFDVYGDSGAIPTPLKHPCGFNDFPNLLVIRHHEWKALIKQIVPERYLDAAGNYMETKGSYISPDSSFQDGRYFGDSALEKLSHWPCKSGSSLELLKTTKNAP